MEWLADVKNIEYYGRMVTYFKLEEITPRECPTFYLLTQFVVIQNRILGR